ncbi:hypothetical protein R9X47_26595 [Wukongibacter baidiensis]|uniref:DUF3566 domain-containing protein n=1 Tax=Wukongibacter baidiensis TaxID=1723361 RepID=UPI003D7F66DE
MKKLELKKITPKSAFKVTLYFAIIPVALMILVGIIALLIGIGTRNGGVAMFGGAYLIAPIFMFFMYGAFAALFALIYNVASNRFGGLEIVVDEEDVDTYDI